jgi:hypothetical protein
MESRTESPWFVQHLCPDGWWDLCLEDDEPLAYQAKQQAEEAIARWLKHSPESNYRISQERSLRQNEDGDVNAIHPVHMRLGTKVECRHCGGRAILTTTMVLNHQHPIFVHCDQQSWIASPHVVEADDVMVGRTV